MDDGFMVLYYPQKKVLGLFWSDMFWLDRNYRWWDMFWCNEYNCRFGTYAQAKEALCRAVRGRGPSVEYFDVDCGG